MAYLVRADYKKEIQTDNLLQVVGSDESILLSAQLAAQAEALSYLRQKYDISQEFRDTLPYSATVAYSPGDRVVLDFPLYSNNIIYNPGDLVATQDQGWTCTTASTTGPFDASKWANLGKIGDIFYASIPVGCTAFNPTAPYKVGNKVYYAGNIYTCQRASVFIGHDAELQYRSINNIPYPNTFPSDPLNGVIYWGIGTPYTVTPGIIPTNTASWTKGDNRDQQMVLYFVIITLYHVHSRISPRNIPELRVKRYDDAIAWLKMCANGDVTPGLPVLLPRQGSRIRYGGRVKNQNDY